MNLHLDDAGGAVAVLGDDELGHALRVGLADAVGVQRLPFLARMYIVLAVDEEDDVGVLLDGAGLAQVAEHRDVGVALLGRTGELRAGDDRHVRARAPAP